MSLLSNIEKFNTHSMCEESVLTLVTGRDKLIQNISLIIDENIKQPSTIQHLVLIGPRGMGKSFLLRYFQIITKKNNTSDDFTDFSLLPEEQHNINSASEFIDELIARIDNTSFYSKPSMWDSKNENWENSVNTLKTVIEKKKEKHKNYLFVAAVENIDILLESVFRSKVDESRFRKLLSSMPNFMLFATSLKFDIDTDYNKRLFNAFQKLHVESWKDDDYLHYFNKRFELLKQQNPEVYKQKDIGLLTNKLKAIAQFTGGSPRMAVVLTNLIFNDDAISTAKTLNDIVEDLSPYYQDLMSRMPPKSKILFDALIQEKENISQSDLATKVGTRQATISQAFKWLLENNYINGHRVGGEKQYRYSVADRIFVLFYFKRYVYCGFECSYMRILSDFLVSYYNTKELSRNTIKYLQNGNKAEGIELARMVFQKAGYDYNKINWDNHKDVENEINKVINKEEFKDLFSIAENKFLEKDYHEALKAHKEALEISTKDNDLLNQVLCFEKIGSDYSELKDFNKAIENYQSAYKLSAQQELIPHQVFYLGEIGWNYKELKEFEKAISYHQKALALCEQVVDISRQVWNLGQIGKNYRELKKFEKAIEFHQKTLILCKQIGDISGQALNLSVIGLNYFDIKAFEKAIEYYLKALDLNEHDVNIPLKIWNLGQIGSIYCELTDFEKAIEFHQKAIALSESVGDILNQALNYGQIGRNYSKSNIFNKAIDAHLKSLTLCEQIGNIKDQSWNLVHIASNYSKLKEFEKAIEYHTKDLELNKQVENITNQAWNLGKIGWNYGELELFEKAIEFHQKVLNLSEQNIDINVKIWNLELIGMSYSKQGSYEKAIEFLQKTLELCDQGEVKSLKTIILGLIGLNYRELKSFEKAIEYHQKALDLYKQVGDISLQASNLGQITVNYLLNNSEKGWELLDDENYSDIPKEQILKELGDCVIYKEKWEGKASAFEMANKILTTIKTKDWKYDSNKAVSNFFAGLLQMNISFDLLKDICNEAKGMFGNEGDIIVDAVHHCMNYIENGRDSNYLLKINPDMAIVVKAIIEEAQM